jgi:hypothetical protein
LIVDKGEAFATHPFKTKDCGGKQRQNEDR